MPDFPIAPRAYYSSFSKVLPFIGLGLSVCGITIIISQLLLFYINWWLCTVGLSAFSSGIFLFIFLSRSKMLLFQENHFDIFSPFSTKIFSVPYNDNVRYKTTYKKIKGQVYEQLSIYHKSQTYVIAPGLYKNYEEIKAVLGNEIEDVSQWKDNQILIGLSSSIIFSSIFASILFTAATAFLLYGVKTYANDSKQVNAPEVITVSGIIDNGPFVNKTGKPLPGEDRTQIEIYLDSYPHFYFLLNDRAIEAGYCDDLLKYVFTGDSIFLDVSKFDFLKKMQNENLKLSNKKKYPINVYGIRDRNRNYLTEDQYNKNKFSHVGDLFPIAFYFLFLMGMFFFLFRFSLKTV